MCVGEKKRVRKSEGNRASVGDRQTDTARESAHKQSSRGARERGCGVRASVHAHAQESALKNG